MSELAFCSIGNMCIDDLVFADGSTLWGQPGGNSIYAALGMALWGVGPAVIARYGPEYPLDVLGSGRIDLTPSKTVPVTLRNWGLYEDNGYRQFVFRLATRNWLDFCPEVADLGRGPYRHCHLAPLPWHRHLELAAALRARGADLISVDPDDRSMAALDDRSFGRLLALIDLFLPSRQDVEAILPACSAVDALRRMREVGPTTAVIAIKCGADGVILHRAGAREYVLLPSIAADIVDATGAGDAFCGGFLVGFAEHRDPIEAALRGSVSASFAVGGAGPAGLAEARPASVSRRLAALRGRAECRQL